jgi:dTDP-4-dehydrorhamnose 3,5-epimerase
VTSESADVEYKCTAPWDPDDEVRIAWDDPRIAATWPVTEPLLSDRDRSAPRVDAVESRLPRWEPPR